MRTIQAVALTMLAGCGSSKVEFAELAYILADQRAACEERVAGVASAWNTAIDARVDFNREVAFYATTLAGKTLDARIQARREQAEPRLAKLEDGSGEIRVALIDIAGKVAALCSAAADPEGFALMSFNDMRRTASVELDELETRMRILLGAAKVPDETKARLDAYVENVVQEATAALALEERKKAEAEAAEATMKAENEELERQSRAALRAEEARIEEAKRAEADENAALHAADVRQRQAREAEEHRTRQIADCASSKAWRHDFSQRFISLGLRAKVMTCGELSTEARGLEVAMNSLPTGIRERADRLAFLLRTLAKDCGKPSTRNGLIAANEAEKLAERFETFQNFCTENGLS
jgi:hypothetical protein